MRTPPVEESGVELLLHEIRDEASSLTHHPVEEVRRLNAGGLTVVYTSHYM